LQRTKIGQGKGNSTSENWKKSNTQKREMKLAILKEETNMATGICFIGGFSISPSVRKKRKKNNMNFRPNYNSVA
jgi:hypothetical protein